MVGHPWISRKMNEKRFTFHMLHKCVYPRCVGQSTKSWVSCPVALHWLFGKLKEGGTTKHSETINLMSKKEGFKFKSKLFCSSLSKKQDFNLDLFEEEDIKSDNATDVLQQWLTTQNVKFNLDKGITNTADYALANLCEFKGKWATATSSGSNMKIVNSFNYTQDVKYEARFLQLPLQDEDLELLIIVPSETDQLNTLFRRLASEGRSAAFESVQPVFTTTTKLDAPSVHFTSQTDICLKNEGINYEGRAIQYGHANVDGQGIVIQILTCVISTPNPPPIQETVVKDKPPFFFAVIHKDSPIFTGQFTKE